MEIASAISPLIQQTMRGQDAYTTQDAQLLDRSAALAANKDVSRAIRDTMTGENTLEVSAGNDTVTISDKARSLLRNEKAQRSAVEEQAETASSTGESQGGSGVASGGSSGSSASGQTLLDIQKQIRQLEEQISQAKQQLSQKTGGGSERAAPPKAAGEGEAPEGEAPEGEAKDGAPGQTRASGGSDEDPEVKAIENEIDMMELQLQQLNYELMEMTKNASGTIGNLPCIGSAGIGGTGDTGGLGERISVG